MCAVKRNHIHTNMLQRGYSVAATSRNLPELQQAVRPEDAQFLPLRMDLGDEASVQQALAAAGVIYEAMRDFTYAVSSSSVGFVDGSAATRSPRGTCPAIHASARRRVSGPKKLSRMYWPPSVA